MAIHYGYYLPKTQQCSACGATWQTYEEKMTDVNIAVEMLSDAYENRFDTAIVVSANKFEKKRRLASRNSSRRTRPKAGMRR